MAPSIWIIFVVSDYRTKCDSVKRHLRCVQIWSEFCINTKHLWGICFVVECNLGYTQFTPFSTKSVPLTARLYVATTCYYHPQLLYRPCLLFIWPPFFNSGFLSYPEYGGSMYLRGFDNYRTARRHIQGGTNLDNHFHKNFFAEYVMSFVCVFITRVFVKQHSTRRRLFLPVNCI